MYWFVDKLAPIMLPNSDSNKTAAAYAEKKCSTVNLLRFQNAFALSAAIVDRK